MKHIFAGLSLLFSSFLILASCSDEKTPLQQYGNTVTQSYKNARRLDNKVNVLEVRKSIQEFHAANGRYPTDLNEITGFNGIVLNSDQYDYDGATGTLLEKQ
jgi:hypothetical protein